MQAAPNLYSLLVCSHRDQKPQAISENPRPPPKYACPPEHVAPQLAVVEREQEASPLRPHRSGRMYNVTAEGLAVSQGCVLCVQFSIFVLLPLLLATALAVALLLGEAAPVVHDMLPDPTGTTEETLADSATTNAPPSKAITLAASGPRAEMVLSCTNCESRRPLGARLVWRTAPGQPPSGAGGDDESFLWDYPDIVMDVPGTWTLCPRLNVLVPTAPERRAQRSAIRATWGWLDQYPNCTLRVVFLLRLPPGRKELAAIQKEYEAFKDIVAEKQEFGVRPQPSSTAALIVEWVPMHLHGLQWAVRVTDDTHVRVLALLDVLDRWAPGPRVFGRASADRGHLEGCAYAAKSEDFLRLQPAFGSGSPDQDEGLLVTGLLARRAGLVPTHLDGVGPCGDGEAAAVVKERFRTGNFSATYLTMRGLSPEQMAVLHRGLQRLAR
ncbi:hypothetical protein HPB49_018039 [Dermacentor silvarum]|uniref:Uncharacterized protein n=1 Tax=Dermacentor silvarum TaxID=543639 RepID=A0ACB8CYZ1_DERSI|nr:hypothetical protein HPB49_018039 [Dermacentor silvarum]